MGGDVDVDAHRHGQQPPKALPLPGTGAVQEVAAQPPPCMRDVRRRKIGLPPPVDGVGEEVEEEDELGSGESREDGVRPTRQHPAHSIRRVRRVGWE